MTAKPKFGSTEWQTHMRRSLAQRKRYGEHITDIEGLIKYIMAQGPAKSSEKKAGGTSSKASQTRSKAPVPPQKPVVGLPGLTPFPKILKVR